MVDVGYEKASSWENVHNVLRPALARVGVDLQIIRTIDYRDNELFDPQQHLVLPAYQRTNGQVHRFNTHCSSSWKMRVAMRWMREQGLVRVIGWVGISTDEARRRRPSPAKWYSVQYPLLDLGMDRLACYRVLWEMGWNDVRHTSCYICPQQSNEQWLYLYQRYPADWARATAIDEAIRQRDPSIYLHRSGLALDDWIETQKRTGWPAIGDSCQDGTGCVNCQ